MTVTDHSVPNGGATRSTAATGIGRWADRLFPRWYPWLMGLAETAGQAEVRRAQLADARGRTLEIGAGSGLSLPHYTSAVDELVLVEPDPGFRARLQATLRGLQPVPCSWVVTDDDAHALPFRDASFDTVTASFTFCSVAGPEQALREVHRVLRPGGRFLFHEHVRGPGPRRLLQNAVAPLQVSIAGGCHPNRDFESYLDRSPLHVDHLVHDRMPHGFPTVTPVVIGSASR
jgi:ubiquinone/menaquinone biosynthesis C-methylase UbiE